MVRKLSHIMKIKTTSSVVLRQWLESLERNGLTRIGRNDIDFSANGVNIIEVDKEFMLYNVKRDEIR